MKLDQTTSADMHVKLTVEKSCKFSVDDMDFGSHASDSGEIDVATNANITCTTGTAYSISSASNHDYSMKNKDASEEVAYALYGDDSRSQELSTTSLAETGTGTVQNIPIYGKVTADALSQAPAGDYTDTVTLTVTY
ncbi:Csu type fimbrial protein [Kluyvera sp. CHPC 1.251]|uniref:Csu type fimbrial protein n=1 Tax=Kluyvera sp. CHPC 1.251 TaxID=2995175 RepID=UPI002FD85EF0